MKRLAALLLPVFALGLTACAEYGYNSNAYGNAYEPAYYDGYYDNYYGPIYSGYWDSGSTYYYSTGPGRAYVPDRGGHFRRNQFSGSHSFHTPDRDHHDHGDHSNRNRDWRRHN